MDNIISQIEELNENMSRLIEIQFSNSLKEDDKLQLMQEMASSMERAQELSEQMYYQISNIEERLSSIEDKISLNKLNK